MNTTQKEKEKSHKDINDREDVKEKRQMHSLETLRFGMHTCKEHNSSSDLSDRN